MRISDWSSDLCSSDLRIHHRSVEVEAVAERKNEARNAARHAETVELFEELRHRRFGRGGRKSDQQRFADITDQLEDAPAQDDRPSGEQQRSEEHTSELQSLMRTAYAAFCLKNNKQY